MKKIFVALLTVASLAACHRGRYTEEQACEKFLTLSEELGGFKLADPARTSAIEACVQYLYGVQNEIPAEEYQRQLDCVRDNNNIGSIYACQAKEPAQELPKSKTQHYEI